MSDIEREKRKLKSYRMFAAMLLYGAILAASFGIDLDVSLWVRALIFTAAYLLGQGAVNVTAHIGAAQALIVATHVVAKAGRR